MNIEIKHEPRQECKPEFRELRPGQVFLCIGLPYIKICEIVLNNNMYNCLLLRTGTLSYWPSNHKDFQLPKAVKCEWIM